MTSAEKLAYLKGVIDASHITDSKQEKIYKAVIDLLDSIVEDIDFNAENIDNIDSRLSEVDEDLELVESILYDDELDDGFEEDEEEDYDESDEDFDAAAFLNSLDFDDEEDEIPEEDEEEEDSEPEEEDFEDDELDDELDDEELEDEEGEEMYEIECPACHETIYLQESVILDGGVDCPNCGEPLEFDIEFEEE